MYRITTVAIALVVLPMSFITSVLGSIQEWLTYQDPSGTFTISYPSGWITDPGNGEIMFRAPSETFSDAYRINAAVTVSVNNLPSLSDLQDLTDFKLKIIVPSFDQTIVESKNTILADRPAYMTVKDQKSSIIDIGMGSEQKIMEVWTINDDKWYNITFVAPADKYEQYFPIVHSMIESFRIAS